MPKNKQCKNLKSERINTQRNIILQMCRVKIYHQLIQFNLTLISFSFVVYLKHGLSQTNE